MRLCTFILCLLLTTVQIVQGQHDTLTRKINELGKVSDIPFDNCKNPCQDCGDKLIWEIVQFGQAAILPLIEKLGDTSYSNIYFKDLSETIRLRTGDIAYITLGQIVSIPTFVITHIQFDVVFCGGYQSGFFKYLSNVSNRQKFRSQV